MPGWTGRERKQEDRAAELVACGSSAFYLALDGAEAETVRRLRSSAPFEQKEILLALQSAVSGPGGAKSSSAVVCAVACGVLQNMLPATFDGASTLGGREERLSPRSEPMLRPILTSPAPHRPRRPAASFNSDLVSDWWALDGVYTCRVVGDGGPSTLATTPPS